MPFSLKPQKHHKPGPDKSNWLKVTQTGSDSMSFRANAACAQNTKAKGKKGGYFIVTCKLWVERGQLYLP